MSKFLKSLTVQLFSIVFLIINTSCELLEINSGELPTIITLSVSEVSENGAKSGGNISNDGGETISSRGIVWSTESSPSLENHIGLTIDGSGVGTFISDLTSLQPGVTYFVKAYATNKTGTGYGEEISFSTLGTKIVEVTNPITGRTWMDRDLGAKRAAISSNDTDGFGDLYQWGRDNDGHQIRTSKTRTNLSNNDSPGHGDFILPMDETWDWRSPSNDNLWQGINGINNPCPSGFRIPTLEEWQEEVDTWTTQDAEGAFSSVLKIPLAGYRNFDGNIIDVGSAGGYWLSTTTPPLMNSAISRFYKITDPGTLSVGYVRTYGGCVRCIKD